MPAYFSNLLPTISISELQFSAVLFICSSIHSLWHSFFLSLFMLLLQLSHLLLPSFSWLNSYTSFETELNISFFRNPSESSYPLDYIGHLCPLRGLFQFSRYLYHWTQHNAVYFCDSEFFEDRLSVLFYSFIYLFFILNIQQNVWHIIFAKLSWGEGSREWETG